MGKSILDGYTTYTTPAEVQKSAIEDNQLGNVGTSVTFSVSYSLSVSWTFSWSLYILECCLHKSSIILAYHLVSLLFRKKMKKSTKGEFLFLIMKQELLEHLLTILHSEQKVELSYVNDILSDNLNQKSKRQFVDLINCLRDQSIRKVINPQDNIIYLFFNNIKALLLINTDECSKLTRLEILPMVNNSEDSKSLYDCLLDLDAKTYLCFHDTDEEVRTNSVGEEFAIASLIKVFVGVIILEAVKTGVITLEDTYQISQYDLSYLSSGITENNIGQDISIQELLSYLFLASDNTAMDILLTVISDKKFVELGEKISHEFKIRIVPTKEILRRAWCKPNLSEEVWRENAVRDVKWLEGLDYFINPKLLNIFIEKLMSYKWTPYTELSSIIYKGGNAPGVLSGFWGNKYTGKFVYFILNRDRAFNIIEEMYCYKCVFNFLERNIEEKNHG